MKKSVSEILFAMLFLFVISLNLQNTGISESNIKYSDFLRDTIKEKIIREINTEVPQMDIIHIQDSIKLYYDSAQIISPLEIVTLEGRFLKEQFYNKAGKEIPGVFDWFFETSGEKYFVKISAGNIATEKLEIYKNELLHASVYISEGLWDTDDPNVQSRIGKYIVLMRLIP